MSPFTEKKKCPSCYSENLDLRLRVFTRIDIWNTSNRGFTCFHSMRGHACLSCGYNFSL